MVKHSRIQMCIRDSSTDCVYIIYPHGWYCGFWVAAAAAAAAAACAAACAADFCMAAAAACDRWMAAAAAAAASDRWIASLAAADASDLLNTSKPEDNDAVVSNVSLMLRRRSRGQRVSCVQCGPATSVRMPKKIIISVTFVNKLNKASFQIT